MATNCSIGVTGTNANFGGPGISASVVSAVVGSTITAANTAFMLQSTAFIGSPPNPAPDQQGGGVWARGVEGNVNIKSTGTVNLTGTFPAGTGSAAVNCQQQVDVNFGGVQIGSDIAKLNYNGWNFHSGVTAGDLGTKAVVVGGFPTYPDIINAPPATIQGGGQFTGATHVPFIGLYGAATNGGFAVDALFRTQWYQTAIDAPVANIFDQSIDARGWTFATSASYQWPVPDTNWFIEPSAGLIISHIKVDPFVFQSSGFGPADSVPSILTFNNINSDIGRLGLRFGETVEAGGVYWQPFGAVSVWHEFGKDITANYQSGTGFQFTAPTFIAVGPAHYAGSSSLTTFGTYGQYSVGLSAAVAGTGWLEFVRADYRSGPDLQGWSASGGLRYQFTPGAAPKPVIAKAGPAPVVKAVNWTGFYVGGFGGATQGVADWGYTGGSVSPHVGGYLFGADVGYNYQLADPYVLGVEVDWARAPTTGGIACGPSASAGPFVGVAGGPSMYQMTCNARTDWIASATARLGYAWERALFYVKGGAAWTDEKFQATCNFGVFNTPAQPYHCTNPAGAFSNGLSGTADRVGWVFGWGSEYALTDHWSAKGEADYVSFGDRNITATDVTAGNAPSTIKVGMHVWEEKIGVNYRF